MGWDMYVEPIVFEHDMPVALSALKLGYYHLHCHADVIEVIMVISGSAHVKVSFEQFYLEEGDYIVVNKDDSHSISATDSKCSIISLYLDINYYKKQIPYLDYVIFACESFDLVKYKNETHYLRRILSILLLDLARYREDTLDQSASARESIIKASEELLWILVSEYAMKNYYNRNWNVSYSKIEKYYTIKKYILENYQKGNIIDYISEKEFYSKTYLTRLFKEVGGSSFQDILTYVRLYKSEKLLLDTDMSIAEISELCGFSDVKYYNRNFKKWFLYAPFEYKKKYLPEVAKINVCQDMQDENIIDKMNLFIKSSNDNTVYKAAITPLILKRHDSVKHVFESHDVELDNIQKSIVNNNSVNEIPHQICIGIDDCNSISNLVPMLNSFCDANYIPVFLVNYKNLNNELFREMMLHCMDIFGSDKYSFDKMEILIVYNSPADTTAISKLIMTEEWPDGFIIKPMLIL